MPKRTCLSSAIEDVRNYKQKVMVLPATSLFTIFIKFAFKALDGFLLLLCGEGSILYICDTIKLILGLSKVRLHIYYIFNECNKLKMAYFFDSVLKMDYLYQVAMHQIHMSYYGCT